MKNKYLLLTVLLLCSTFSYAQNNREYAGLISQAVSLYQSNKYLQSAETFMKAFRSNGGKGSTQDKFNAACVWTLAGKKDSAFMLLNKIANSGEFYDYNMLTAEPDLNSIHYDYRWAPLCAVVKTSQNKMEVNLNKPLAARLDTIMNDDQGGRVKLMELEQKYGYESKEVRELWKKINHKDSVNLIKVEQILNKYGWLGKEKVGVNGNATLFLVIQHANLKTQIKYLPIMRKAVKNHNANAADLALLEDRVALGQGKKQIYGSQIRGDNKGNYWVSPLTDPDNVDKRRAAVGLPPMAEYVQTWKIKWNPLEYKNNYPK